MPKIKLCFSGWIRNLQVGHAFNDDHDDIDVSNMTSSELIEKLQRGELSIDFVACLRDSNDTDVEMFDIEEDED